MNFPYSKAFLLLFIQFLFSISTKAQTQDDFMSKLTDVYTNASDQKKAKEIALEMQKMVDQKKDLQTYSNYLILVQIFETQVVDKNLAKSNKEKADKLLAEMTHGAGVGDDASTEWLNVYYPALFSNKDPDIANKASNFLSKHPSLQHFNNYNFLAYAYEKSGDFQKAKENYEHAMSLIKDINAEYYSFSFYTNFLSKSGEYLKAEENIKKMESLALTAPDMLKQSYKSEAMTSKVVLYLSIGDYHSYLEAANEQYDYYSKNFNNFNGCDPYPMSRYTLTAFAQEMLKDYKNAEASWRIRDSSNIAWINCIVKQFPDNKQYPLSMLPVYQLKIGKKSSLNEPISYYIKETETHYDSYKQYADLSINAMRAQHLGFLYAPQYHEQYKPVLDRIINSKDFSQSTQPFLNYGYFTMRDRHLEKSKETYDHLFKLNIDWINDVIFSFGEKAFVSYYNSKLKEGYENYHSFVKIAKEKYPKLLPHLSSQAYNNLLFTKSLSLKGTQKRKEAFLKANDQSIAALYEEWLKKKQDLIRLYRRSEDATSEVKNSVNQEELKKMQDDVNRLENELAAKAKDFKKYLKIETPDWKTIRDNLKEGEAAVEMVRFQWRDQIYYTDTAYYAAYIITKTSQHPEVVYMKDLADDLDHRFYKAYQNSIKFKVKDNGSYDHYWKPIKEHLNGIKKIYFSPDGIYHLINMPTLFNTETGGYLLDEMEIHYITSSNDVQDNFQGLDIKNAVLIGRPAYKIENNQMKLASVPEDPSGSFVRSFKGNTVSDLPGTEEEVTTIKKEMEKYGVNVSFYTKENATEDKVYQLHSPHVLHIATHGYWAELPQNSTAGFRTFNAMANSGLLMSGVVNYYSSNEYPDTYDGIVTAYEAQNLDLENTSLVVLSACETSLGHMDAGEGVYGLQRAFRAAGAKSIMTSLWKVDDAATKEFMIIFYQHLLKSKNKFEAFRTAQKTLKEKYPDPYYWGAFILSGN